MAQRIEHFTVATPASTPLPVGLFTELAFNEGIVTGVRVRIPAGHAGRTGLQLWYSGVQVIPFRAGRFLRGNKGTYDYDIEDFPTGTSWVAFTFNNDRHPHTFRIDLLLDEFGEAAEAELAPIVLIPPVGGTLVGLGA